MNLENHVVVCNWNEKSPELVKELHAEFHSDSPSGWHTIVVVAPNIASFPDDEAFGDTVLIPGDPGNKLLLERACVEQAHTIIILPDLRSSNPDDDVLRIALTVKSLLWGNGGQAKERSRHTRVVAKIVDANNAPSFKQTKLTGIHEVICEGDLGLRVLAQTSIAPGLTYVLKDLLDYSKKNSELYLTPVPQDWLNPAEPLDSFQAVTKLAFERAKKLETDSGVIPVGYFRLRENGGYDILVNPKPKQFAEKGITKVAENDQLLVLAVDGPAAQAFLHGRSG